MSWPLGGTPVAGVPPTLGDACRLVADDLAAAPPLRGSLPGDRWWAVPAAPSGTWLVGLARGDQPVFVFGTDVSRGPAEVTAAVADGVQGRLVGYEFHQWPPCPAHRHPLTPAVRHGTARWVCDRDATVSVPIGSLR